MNFSSPYSPSDLDKINEVLPYLFIGSYGAAENLEYLREQRITHAICLLSSNPSLWLLFPIYVFQCRTMAIQTLAFC